MPGGLEGPRDDPLWTQLLLGLHRRLLEPGQAERPVQLPPVQAGVPSETAAEQKHGPRRSGGEATPVWVSGSTRGQGGEVQRLHGEESHSREILRRVPRVVLRGSLESPRRELPREVPQADPGFRSAEREAVSTAPQSPEAVLPHGSALRLFPVRQRETQGPRRNLSGRVQSDTTGAWSG